MSTTLPMSTPLPDPHTPGTARGPRDGRPGRRATDRPPDRRATDRPPDPGQAARRLEDRRPEDRTAVRRTVSLVVPAHNEARNIPWVFEQIPRCVDEVILVDGDSSDATLRMATHCLPGVRSVRQNGPGKGSALRTGFRAATGSYVVMMDADGSMSPGEIPHYLHFLDHGYDFVKGSRFMAGGGSQDLTPVRALGNRALLALVNQLYDARMTDLCYGFCAFRRSFLDELDLSSTGFEIEAEMIAHALRSGLRIAEVPSLELPRRNGRSHLRAVADGRRVLRTLLAERPGVRQAAAAVRPDPAADPAADPAGER
jgi:Glycosyl transferase family 2